MSARIPCLLLLAATVACVTTADDPDAVERLARSLHNHPPLEELASYALTDPVVLHDVSWASPVGEHPTRIRAARAHTLAGQRRKEDHAVHRGEAAFAVTAYGRRFHLQLQLNRELFPENFRVLGPHGEVEEEGAENCYYSGFVEGDSESIVSMTTCGEGLDGFFHVNGDTYVLSPASAHPGLFPKRTGGLGQHVIYRMADLPQGMRERRLRSKCATHDQQQARGDDHKEGLEHALHTANTARRALLQTGTKYVELLLVNDARQVTVKGGNTQATDYAKSIANAVATLYAHSSLKNTVHIVVVLVAVQNWNSATNVLVNGATVSAATDITAYLRAFTTWTQSNGVPGTYDNAHLLTGWAQSGGVAGVAWVGTMCGRSSSGVNEDSSGSTVWTVETVTHEMGHNFGSSHDSSGNTCAQSGFIMAAVGSVCGGSNCPTSSTLTWSTCSLNYISNKVQGLTNTPSDCLADQPTPLGSVATCGDSIVTAPEQCDNATSPAICTDTCTFKADVVCTSGVCCDVNTGKFKAAGTQCRAALHQCDLADYCSGSSADCPTNIFKPDGTVCTESGPESRCYSGSCIGYDDQCEQAGVQYLGQTGWTHGNCPSVCDVLLCKRGSGGCSFIQVNGDNGVMNITVKDKTHGCTPCSNSSGYGCFCNAASGTCVDSSGPLQCNPPCKAGQGVCSSSGTCACSAGWTGADCSQVQPCDADCKGIGRQSCVPTVKDPTRTVLNEPCYLEAPDVTFSHAGSDGQNPEHAFDDDPFSHWEAQVNASGGEYPVLRISFESTVGIQYYVIESSNDLPEQDPTDWELASVNSDGSLEVMDSRTGEMWNQRHLSRAFQVSKPGYHKHFALRIKQTRGAGTGVGAVQVATFTLYADNETGAGHESALIGSVVAVTCVVLIAVAALTVMRRREAHPCLGKAGGAPKRKLEEFEEGPSASAPASAPAAPREGPAAPATSSNGLPSGWEQYYTETGVLYYWNEVTGESRWDVPTE